MNASAKPKPTETPVAQPTLAQALEVMEAARAQDRSLTADETRLVGLVMNRADRPGAAAIFEAGRLLDVAAQARAARENYAAADRARARSADFAATRAPAFAELPPWLQLQWSLLERAGGRSTVEGRALARLLEDVGRGEPLQPPACFMPTPGQP
jgi:hypothetical protein